VMGRTDWQHAAAPRYRDVSMPNGRNTGAAGWDGAGRWRWAETRGHTAGSVIRVGAGFVPGGSCAGPFEARA